MPGTLPDYLTTGEVVNIAVQKGVLTEGMAVSSKLAEALKQVAIEIHNKAMEQALLVVTEANLRNKLVCDYGTLTYVKAQPGMNYGQIWVVTAARKELSDLKVKL